MTDVCAEFRALHASGCFVLPNPWDAGSAQALAAMGFKALASTSYGAALALGFGADYALGRDQVLAHLRVLVKATALPVNADFEGGFADAPEGVAESVALAVATGIAGLSIEDRTAGGLYPLPQALDRLRAAKAAAGPAVLVARTEGLLLGDDDLGRTIDRAVAMAALGVDCVYAPGLRDLGAVATLVRAVAPTPVNVLLMGDLTVQALADAGVRRVSTGGALYKVAANAVAAAARQLLAGGLVST